MERPESTYALRVGGWVRSKVYSHIQGRWAENNCVPVFIIFELLQSPVFMEDENEL